MTPEQHAAVDAAMQACSSNPSADNFRALNAALEPLTAVDLARLIVEDVPRFGHYSDQLYKLVHARMEFMLAVEQAAAQEAAAEASAKLTKGANRLALAAAGLALLQVVIQILQWRYGS